MSKNKEELRDRINKTVHKNCLKGLWLGLKKLEVKDCKIGDIVLTKAGSVFEISEIRRNKKRENDLTISVGWMILLALCMTVTRAFSLVCIN
ncbi:hypothetical protein BSPWISOXPB_4374 [uncultured Gammaproteobacteria bacterium]|nr:hypothetical protein BSPWISOXPB_4374 [uncultured Gammaproteobacteria bacterium]